MLSADPIDVAAVRAQVSDPGFGAVLVFEGVARDHFGEQGVTALEYEAYPELCVPVVDQVRQELSARWPGCKLAVAHRTGLLQVGDTSMVIAVGTAHRGECYAASRYAIEAIKERLPVWKKEHFVEGGGDWRENTPREVDTP